MFFIGILLFNYVNSTMFWHNHLVDGQIVGHSHIYGKAHCTDNSDGGHTPGQLKLLDLVSHILCTDTVIPDIHVGGIDIIERVFLDPGITRIPSNPGHQFSL